MQVDARQARLARSREANRRRRQPERQSEPQQTNVPALEEDLVQGKLIAFHAKMSSLSFTPVYAARARIGPLDPNHGAF